MDLLVLNTNLEAESVIDAYESLIWTDRYFEYGDFEIYTPVTMEMLLQMREGYYLWNRESEHVMIIEENRIRSDVEFGNHIIVTGRSLESILCRRIVWESIAIKGSLQDGIEKLISDAIISPKDATRKIKNFVFVKSNDASVTKQKIDVHIEMGENLYDVISTICSMHDIGFKIVINSKNQFVFSLYSGKDRSYAQIENPFVVFSPDYENIINSNYVESSKSYKTVSLVAGDGEGKDQVLRTVSVDSGPGEGLTRREMYTDARFIQREGTDDEYFAQLDSEGKKSLKDNKLIRTFEGEVDTTNMFVYDRDFFLGDVVQVANEYGAESRSRVVEFIRSQDPNGFKAYPTFVLEE